MLSLWLCALVLLLFVKCCLYAPSALTRSPSHDITSPDGRFRIEAYAAPSLFGGFGQGEDAEGWGKLVKVKTGKVLHTFRVSMVGQLGDAVWSSVEVGVDSPDGGRDWYRFKPDDLD